MASNGNGNGAHNGHGGLDAASLRELHQLAACHPRSGREAVAKASALRTIERLQRERRKQEVPPRLADWFPSQPGDPFFHLDWDFLRQHPHTLDRQWVAAWREGRA